MVERLAFNLDVVGSSPTVYFSCVLSFGEIPKWLRGRFAKPLGPSGREGSNPSLSAKKSFLIFIKKYVIINYKKKKRGKSQCSNIFVS